MSEEIEITIEELRESFDGRAESRGFKFLQMDKTDTGYIYRVNSGTKPHYEIFERRTAKKIESFNPTTLSETERREIYPNRNVFGKSAWTTGNYERAQDILAEIESTVEARIKNKARRNAKAGN